MARDDSLQESLHASDRDSFGHKRDETNNYFGNRSGMVKQVEKLIFRAITDFW